ncbi:MAG TPA: cation diffusion facilitator family transporter [Pyrinomonadaceae bacterium]|jgi:cation diffusion facilitator family transporter
MLAVLGALFANGLITVLKFIGAMLTGSSGMMAESLHSLADTTNQVFLLLGLRFYRRPASEKHPFGYGKERFFWSFIAAIFIFGVGATYAVYEGIAKLSHPHPPERVGWAYAILGASFVIELGSIGLAIYQEVNEARHAGMSFMEYLRESKDPTAKTVLFEDTAALIGIVIAAAGLYLTEHHAGPGGGAYWDGVASITIGLVLAVVAFVLARSARGLLLGEAATKKTLEVIRGAIASHANVTEVIELLTMHLAPKQILINAHVQFRDDLATGDIERTVKEVEQCIKTAEPMVDMIFIETSRRSEPGPDNPIPQHIG